MPIEIPYTFIAGTKAKASEVNADFNAVANFVDQLEVNSAEIETLVNTLSENKADINGSTSEIFRMGDAVSDYDGVNLRTLRRLTANSKEVVFGFKVSKQSNTAVNATAGACWDSTYTDMMISNTNLLKDQAGLSANATYYVYVTSDKETGECELVISLSNSTPELPSGYEYYRRLATITTDGDGYIDTVVQDGEIDISKKVGFIGTPISTPSSPATQNMWIYGKCWANNSWYTISVGGVEVANQSSPDKWGNTLSSLIPVMKGQAFSANSGGEGHSITYLSMV